MRMPRRTQGVNLEPMVVNLQYTAELDFPRLVG